jgi:hypothetical protein
MRSNSYRQASKRKADEFKYEYQTVSKAIKEAEEEVANDVKN